MAYKHSGMSSATKIATVIVSIIILAGLAFILAGLICSSINGTGFAEEITSWFTKTAEVVEDPEEVVATAINGIASFFKLV